MDPKAIVENFRKIVTEHYFDFEGRVGRPTFWYFVLAYFVILLGVAIIQSIIGLHHFLTWLLHLALLLPSLGLAARRLHDTDRNAWWLLIGLVPIVGWILLIYWYTLPGTSGRNQFGSEAAPMPSAPTAS